MVHVQISETVRETLGILKTLYNAKRLNDDLDSVLKEHEPEAYNTAASLLRRRDEMQKNLRRNRRRLDHLC
jgi:uridylate kinase